MESPPLLETLREHVVLHAADLAVIDGGQTYTYGQLASWAAVIADELCKDGVAAGDRVAIAMPRGAGAVALLIAILGLGATYVPLDLGHPSRRLRYILEDSEVRHVFSWESEAPWAAAALTRRLPAAPREAVRGGWKPQVNIGRLTAYIIYTSGSTGWPKGVGVSSSCLDNVISWQCRHSVRPDLRTAQFAPLNFDVSIQEILGTLCGGGTLTIVPEFLRHDPFELIPWLAQERIERLFLPYLGLQMLAVAAATEPSLDELRLVEVNTAGEQLVCTPAIRDFFRRRPKMRLNNHYGPSETHVVTSHTLSGSPQDWPVHVPIGVPLPGCELLIDTTGGEDASGPQIGGGELLVGGRPVSDGAYVNLPILTEQKFLSLPRTPAGNTRFYRTGDMVLLQDDGALRFLGRSDQEIKVRGTRVDLLEVEACLMGQPHVVEAACVGAATGDGGRTLHAAVATDGAGQYLDTARLLQALAEILPGPAVPTSVTVMAALPRTASGKIDRRTTTDQILQSLGFGPPDAGGHQ